MLQCLQSGNTESVDLPIWLLIGVKCTLLNLRWIRRRWKGPWGVGWGRGRGWKRQSPQWEQSLLWGEIQYKRTMCHLRSPSPANSASSVSLLSHEENLWFTLIKEWFYTLCCESSRQPEADPLSSIYNLTYFMLASLTTRFLLKCD